MQDKTVLTSITHSNPERLSDFQAVQGLNKRQKKTGFPDNPDLKNRAVEATMRLS